MENEGPYDLIPVDEWIGVRFAFNLNNKHAGTCIIAFCQCIRNMRRQSTGTRQFAMG